jgi:hypothetical protein
MGIKRAKRVGKGGRHHHNVSRIWAESSSGKNYGEEVEEMAVNEGRMKKGG